jgi:hypothetical protein
VAGIRQVVGAIGALAVLAACGGGGDSGDDSSSDFARESAANIQKAATEDMKALESMHMEGAVTQEENELGRDVTLTADGDCAGTVSISGASSGSAELISVDGTSYVKPDEAFWQAQAGPQAQRIISAVGDDWVQLPEGDESFTAVCAFDEAIDPFGEETKSLEKGATEDVEGQEAVELTRDDKESGGTTSVWVAVDDPHHIVKVEQEGSEASSSFTFSEFDEETTVEAPAEDEVVPAEELQKLTQP